MEQKFDYNQRPKARPLSADPYRLARGQWPTTLQDEFDAYETWRTADLVPGRSWQRQQRPTTFAKTVIEFESYFGFLVNVYGKAQDSLRLMDICNVELLRAYATWHATERANGPSRYIKKTLGTFIAVARHYLKVDGEILDGMGSLKSEMNPKPVRDKRARWVSLITLEAIGKAEYPTGDEPDSVFAALAAQRSLLIRLLVRRPLRNRNLREMRLGRNLYHLPTGWMMEFQGDELKVGRRQEQENIYRISFPVDLVDDLETFLKEWRPVLNIFLSRKGKPLSQNAINAQVRKAIYEHTGRLTNIHMIRDIWATEYIEATQNFSIAASVLGDRLETVLRRYVHLRMTNAGQKADEFIAKILGTELATEQKGAAKRQK